MKVYVYKHCCDIDTYDEIETKVYLNKDEAKADLKSDVEDHYGLYWNEIPNEIMLDDNDAFEEDYVSINDNNGYTFWSIEETELIGSQLQKNTLTTNNKYSQSTHSIKLEKKNEKE